MGPKAGKRGGPTPIPGEEKIGEKVGELDKEKYQIQIRTLGNIYSIFTYIYIYILHYLHY